MHNPEHGMSPESYELNDPELEANFAEALHVLAERYGVSPVDILERQLRKERGTEQVMNSPDMQERMSEGREDFLNMVRRDQEEPGEMQR